MLSPSTLLTCFLASLTPLTTAAQEEAVRYDVEGVVVDTYGTPIEGATLLVYTAKPREGYSPL